MKLQTILLILFMAVPIIGFGQVTTISQHLSAQIDSLKTADQEPATMANATEAEAAFKKVTRSNFPYIKNILDNYGFPGYNLVGKVSSHNYWLLVQHSDFDIEFQKKALKAMKMQVDRSNASGQDYAYLIDRIELNEKRPQVYGTQIVMSPQGTTLRPCLDTLTLDKRRLAVGLSPIKAYLTRCDSIYYEMNKNRGALPPKPRN